MKRFGMLCALLAGALLAGQVQAQAPGQGLYVGIGYSGIWSDVAGPGSENDETTDGGKIYFGKMYSDRWGLELGVHSFGRFDSFFAGTKIFDTKTNAVSISGVAYLPVASGIGFNGRIGLAATEATVTCSSVLVFCGGFQKTEKRGLSGLVGVGLTFALMENLSLRTDFDHFGSVHHRRGFLEYKDSYDVFTISLQLLF